MGNIESIERAVLRAGKKVGLAVGIAGIAYAANFGVAKPAEANPCPTPVPVGKGTLPSSKDCQPSVVTSSVITSTKEIVTSTVKSEVLPSAPILPSGTTIKQEQNVNVNLPEGFVLRPGTFVVTREEWEKMIKDAEDRAAKARGVVAPTVVTQPVTITVSGPERVEYRPVFNEGYPWDSQYPWRVAALWGVIVLGGSAFTFTRHRVIQRVHHHGPAGAAHIHPHP